MKKNLQEVLKENQEKEWQRKKKMIAEAKREHKKEAILTGIVGGFTIVVTILILISMTDTNKYHQYDVNKDGVVNAQDYVTIKDYIMNK